MHYESPGARRVKALRTNWEGIEHCIVILQGRTTILCYGDAISLTYLFTFMFNNKLVLFANRSLDLLNEIASLVNISFK